MRQPMTYTMGVSKRPGEVLETLPPGLTGLPDWTKERLVPHSLISLFCASKHMRLSEVIR